MEFFDVYVLKAQGEGYTAPRFPEVRIVLGDFHEHEGQAAISHGLASDEEIDQAIDTLKQALEDTRKKAKLKLKQLNKRRMAETGGTK